MTQMPFALRDGCILGFLDAPRIGVGAHCDDGTFTAGGFAARPQNPYLVGDFESGVEAVGVEA